MGNEFTILIGREKNVFATGDNISGQLGLANNNDQNEFTLVPGILDNPFAVSCGDSHSIILTEENRVYATGANDWGQLGLRDNVNRNQFTLVPGILDNPIAVGCGRLHSFILTENRVFGTGDGRLGQLGLGDNFNRNQFTLVPGILGTPKAVSCGNGHSIILTDQGVFATGRNKFGQLGLWWNEANRYQFTQVPGILDNPFAVSCGKFNSIILTNEGHVFATGSNTWGQLGLGDNFNRNQFTLVPGILGTPKAVSCGDSYSIILTNEGHVFATGANDWGQLGLGDNFNRNRFEQVQGILGTPKAVSCGDGHSIILTEEGGIYATGANNFGQIGLGNNTGNFYTFQPLEILPLIEQIRYNYCHTLRTLSSRSHYYSYHLPNLGQPDHTVQDVTQNLEDEDLPEQLIDNYFNEVGFTAVG